MNLQVFTVRDSKSNTFGSPMFLQTVGTCIRSLADEVNKNQESMVYQHPEDFELFHLGQWDTDTARFELFPDPKSVVVCSQLKNGSK